jgi:hypothetical protein
MHSRKPDNTATTLHAAISSVQESRIHWLALGLPGVVVAGGVDEPVISAHRTDLSRGLCLSDGREFSISSQDAGYVVASRRFRLRCPQVPSGRP